MKGALEMKDYMTIPEAAIKWGVSAQQVRRECEKSRIRGVIRLSRRWFIPADAVLPPELEYAVIKRISA